MKMCPKLEIHSKDRVVGHLAVLQVLWYGFTGKAVVTVYLVGL